MPRDASPVRQGWYADKEDNLLNVYTVAENFGTGEKVVVFHEHFGDHVLAAQFKSVDEFLASVALGGFKYVPVLSDEQRQRMQRALSRGISTGLFVNKKA